MLRNRRGATSLRWLRALLDHDIEVHGQVVVCPGINDGTVLDDTLAGVLDRFPELASLCIVPLGISKFNGEGRMRPHTVDEARYVVDAVASWQETFLAVLGRRLVFAADEYYLLADRPFPASESYEGFPMHEDGVGMARTFELELFGEKADATGRQHGFFTWADGGAVPTAAVAAPAAAARPAADGAGSLGTDYEPYRGTRATADQLLQVRPSRRAPVGILTGPYGTRVLRPMLARLGRPDVRIVTVENQFFGGHPGVTGLMVGADLARTLAAEPEGHRYLLPDVCLSNGRFLDGATPADLPRAVEVVATDGHALRSALGLDEPALVGSR